jgi:hypothetical protein
MSVPGHERLIRELRNRDVCGSGGLPCLVRGKKDVIGMDGPDTPESEAFK